MKGEMEAVTVSGNGPRAQRLLDELEARTTGLGQRDETRSGSTIKRRYRINAATAEAARRIVREALGDDAKDFTIE